MLIHNNNLLQLNKNIKKNILARLETLLLQIVLTHPFSQDFDTCLDIDACKITQRLDLDGTQAYI